MGYGLSECQQKFQYTINKMKLSMKDEFERFLPQFGLTEFYYRGFLQFHGYCSKVSAADVVYGVTSLPDSC